MHLIPEFDGLNVETFIGHIQIAVKRLAIDQHELLLCSIIAQKLTGRAKGTIRIDATTNFPQLYEKLRFFYGKTQNISALEVQRDTCILTAQRNRRRIYKSFSTHTRRDRNYNKFTKYWNDDHLHPRGTLSTKINRDFSPQCKNRNRRPSLLLRARHIKSSIF